MGGGCQRTRKDHSKNLTNSSQNFDTLVKMKYIENVFFFQVFDFDCQTSH